MVLPEDDPLFRALSAATCRAFREAVTTLPQDVVEALRSAAMREPSALAKNELKNILDNIAIAEQRALPLCQDTGVPVVYLTVPPHVPYTDTLICAVGEGVRRATREIPLRPNVVSPLKRENSGDNTGPGMPIVHVRPGSCLSVTVLPKGAGAENMSRLAMLLPTESEKIPRFVAETMLIAGGRPCPPVILGVGIGGTFDGCAALAKEAKLCSFPSVPWTRLNRSCVMPSMPSESALWGLAVRQRHLPLKSGWPHATRHRYPLR